MNYRALAAALAPEVALVLGALVVLGFDLLAGRTRSIASRFNASVAIALLAVLGAMYGSCRAGLAGDTFGGVLALDARALAARLGVLVLAGLTVAMLPGVSRVRHGAEYIAVILFATAGFTLMAAAQQLLLAFLALELASLSLYVLAGFDQTRAESAEAGLKYFLVGGISAAFLLFGFSLIYGLTGSIELPIIAHQLRVLEPNTLLVVAFVMVLAGFGFKAAAAPFHLWAPDVYQGAPASSAALIASASKLAGFTLFTRLLWDGFGQAGGTLGPAPLPGWVPIVVVISAVSLVLGNIAALAQTNVRRLLAYSAIAHAGAMLVGVIASGRSGFAPLYYYVATYGLATVGAFGVIAVIDRHSRCQAITDLAGLYRRSPLLAACLFVFILSLAGIPPLAGFFGKFIVFASALKLGGVGSSAGGLALFAIAMSAVALYYYLVILKQALVARPVAGADDRIAVPLSAAVVLVLTAALLIGIGLFPSFLLQMIR